MWSLRSICKCCFLNTAVCPCNRKMNDQIDQPRSNVDQKQSDGNEASRFDRIKRAIWNGDTNEFLGRTATSWAKILIFYLVLYLFLAGLFTAKMYLFLLTISKVHPKWENSNGLIGSNPGLGFRPIPSDAQSIIHVNNKTSAIFTSKMEEFLNPYNNVSDPAKFIHCNSSTKPAAGQVCTFDVDLLGPWCSQNDSFGYEQGRPCVLLKLNKIFGWEPELYDDPKNLTDNMPEDLKLHIKEIGEQNDEEMLKMVWISCNSTLPINMTYTPFRGFPAHYFPYNNTQGYLSPIVAVQFDNLEPGKTASIECKLWAKNIVHDHLRRLGSVDFKLLID